VKARSKEPTAPDALLKITEFHKSKADTLGRYVALTPPEQATWKAAVDAAQASSERVLSEYTDSPQVSLALQRLLAVQTLRTEAELQKPEQTEAYFKGLATRFEANAVAKSKILLAYATYIAQTDPTKALELMTQAYDPSAVYSPDDLDRYGELLIENKDLDKAAQVYAKLGEDYPTPADGTPASAEAGKAQAASLFGLGTVAQMQNDSARAKDLFERLKREHPGSPKSLQADLGIARSLMTTADYDGGLALVAPIISVAQAPEKVRAEALYLGGQMHHMKGNSEMAINFFAMVYDYFPGEKDFAPDALWEGAQLVEQAAASEADPKKKADLIARARKAYETIVSEYPDSAFKAKAAERIAALPAK
jgi:outer membrane protein assembly factor BamD (BamD/ComL family)